MNELMTKPNLFEKYCKNKEHAKEVEKYSLMILSALKNGVEDFKNLPEKATEYLSQASLLHDIGYCIEKKSHHKHTMTIIKNEGIENYTNEEIDIIANVARYHRGSFPDTNKHEAFAQLTQENQTLVTKLGAILRLADGLDKPHKNLILRMEANETEETVDIKIKTIGFKPNLKMAEEKKDLLEFVLHKKINFLFM